MTKPIDIILAELGYCVNLTREILDLVEQYAVSKETKILALRTATDLIKGITDETTIQ